MTTRNTGGPCWSQGPPATSSDHSHLEQTMPETTDPQPDRIEALTTEYATTGRVTGEGAVWLISQVVALREQAQSLDARRKASLRRADEINNSLMEEVQRYAEGTERPVLWSVYNRMHGRALNAEAEANRLRLLAVEAPAPNRAGGETRQDEAEAAGWRLTPQTLDLFVRALVNEVDYDIHKGYECGEEDGEDHYPELVADAAEMLDAITADLPAAVSQPGKEA